MMRFSGTAAVICLALCWNVALGNAALVHKHNLNHETTAATFLVNQKDAGGIEDVKAMQLSDSIEGLFDPSTLKADSMQASAAVAASKAAPNASPTVSKKVAEKVVVKLQSKEVAKGLMHEASKHKSVAKKNTISKQSSGSKMIAKHVEKAVAQAKRQEAARVTKASKAQVIKEVSGVVEKMKAFVTKAQQRKAKVDKRAPQKTVSKLLEAKTAGVQKKLSKLVQAKKGVITKIAEVSRAAPTTPEPAKMVVQNKTSQPEPQYAIKAPAKEAAHMTMMPSKLETKGTKQTLSVAPKLAPASMKALPMKLTKFPKPLQASGSFANTLGPLKSTPMLAKIPVAGKPVRPGGPVPVTKLQVAEVASVGSDSSKKNTNFSWFPFSHTSNSSSSIETSNSSDPARNSWFVFRHSSNSSVVWGTNTSDSKNSSVSTKSVKSVNATLDNSTRDNKTKEVEKEKEVEALPMASFAMGLADEPAQNKTEQLQNKSTQPTVLNATERAAQKAAEAKKAAEKAAWDRREKVLREEITLLKARLENDTLELKQHHVDDEQSPPAAGTFNSQADASKDTTDDAAPVKKPEPMEPLIKDAKPKADWPTMKSVAAPVTLHHVSSSEAPPQKEAMEAQAGDSKKVGLNTAFTGTPTKKVQSVMALDSNVQHDSVLADANDDAPVENPTPASFSVWNSVSSFFTRMFWGTAVTPVQHVEAPKKAVTALLDTTQHRVGPRDYDKTAQATRDEASRILAPTSVWGELEEEDKKEEDVVRGEDQSERMRAQTPETPHAESKEELAGRHGTDMSRFWSNLETEDSQIEQSVTSENLGEYERLTRDQDEKVDKADNQLQESKLHTDRNPPLKHSDASFLAKTIHEPWAALEQKDKALEQRIHASPDLQMLQLKDSLRDSAHQ